MNLTRIKSTISITYFGPDMPVSKDLFEFIDYKVREENRRQSLWLLIWRVVFATKQDSQDEV